jgi:hypothetical protein
MNERSKQLLDHLLTFCAGEGELRPFLEKPWWSMGRAVASDGYMLIAIDCPALKAPIKELNNQYAPALPALVPRLTKTFVVHVKKLEEKSAQLQEMYKEQYSIEESECLDCEKGKVKMIFMDKKRKTHEVEVDCPVCEGEGILTKILLRETKEEIFYGDIMLLHKIGGKHISTRFIAKVIETAKLYDREFLLFRYEEEVNKVIFDTENGATMLVACVLQELSDKPNRSIII